MHTTELIDKVRELYKDCQNFRKIARDLKMDHSVVRYMVNNNYNRAKKKRGPKKKIDKRSNLRIKKEVRRLQGDSQKITANKIKINCDVDASVRTIQKALSVLGFGYGKVPKKLPLKPAHKTKRVELARDWIADNLINKNIVFSDEKRFSFDGPDNWFSWYDPMDPPSRIKRQLKGGGIMVWGMTLPSGKIRVRKLEGRVDSSVYTSLLKHHVKPYLNSELGEGNYFLQQDNCKVHVSKETKKYLNSAGIKTFEWPSMSPDMNIQENIWQMISSIVYDGKQFDSADDLWENVVNAVDQINNSRLDTIKKIYDGYNGRLLKVIENNGNEIPY